MQHKGQLIIIGALSLAIVLVGIALVLNSAIYAENLATRQQSVDASQLSAATQGSGGIIAATNRNGTYNGSYANLEAGYQNNTDEWSGRRAADLARNGAYLDISYVDDSAVNGTRVRQSNSTRTLQPAESAALNMTSTALSNITSWAVSRNTTGMRSFTMQVNSTTVDNFTQAEAETYLNNLTNGTDSYNSTAPPFAVAYDEEEDGTLNHSFTIYRASNGQMNLTTLSHTSGTTRTCSVNNTGPVLVDISGGQFATGLSPRKCAAVREITPEPPFTMYFIRGSTVEGEYGFVVNSTFDEFKNNYSNFDDHYNTTNTTPFIARAIYSTKVAYSYRTDSVQYNGTRRVSP